VRPRVGHWPAELDQRADPDRSGERLELGPRRRRVERGERRRELAGQLLRERAADQERRARRRPALARRWRSASWRSFASRRR